MGKEGKARNTSFDVCPKSNFDLVTRGRSWKALHDFLNHVEKEKSLTEKRLVEQSQIKSKLPKLEELPLVDLDERPTDEEDIIVLDETNVDSEDVIFLGDGNVLVLN